MTSKELASSFIANETATEKYGNAIAVLREIGFEQVLRRLGEPAEFALDHTQRFQMAAFEQAEKIGWFRCLDYVFNFIEAFGELKPGISPPDFGSQELLREMGYTLRGVADGEE